MMVEEYGCSADASTFVSRSAEVLRFLAYDDQVHKNVGYNKRCCIRGCLRISKKWE